MVWALDHLADLRADFRAIYRLTPAEAAELSGPEFFELTHRLPCYQGVIRVRAEAQEERDARTRPAGVRQVEGTREAILADSLLRDAISFS